MAQRPIHMIHFHPQTVLVWDLSDCFTGSFPEFVPFCSKLYYFSNFKDFRSSSPA